MTDDRTPATVLVVDDDALNRRLLGRGVEHLGHRVTSAADGAGALEMLRRGDVDLVLLDLVLPGIDGFEVLTAMRADPDLADVPVIVISSIDESEQMARSIALGAVDHLGKPFDPVLLRVRVDTALHQRRLRQIEQDYLRQEVMLREQDKLATLGRLSAGLAHEINNPVAAVMRLLGQLGDRLERSDAALVELVPAVAEHLVRSRQWGAATPRPDRDETIDEDEVERALDDAGITDPWRWAGELAGFGIGADAARELIATTDRTSLDATLHWLVARASSRRLLDQASGALERVAEIVGALRSYSHLDRGQRQAVDIHAGIEDTLVILEHKAPHGVRIRRDYDPSLPMVDGSGSELNQVWTNVIDNAFDAVGEQGCIRIRTETADVEGRPHVVVEIEDDGPGIEPELLGRVFDPFVTTKEPGRGTGLGLNISHRIVTASHGGRLEISSRPGCTTVRVALPLGREEP